MRASKGLALLAAAAATRAASAKHLKIVMSNDDGWAEINIRAFYTALSEAGHHAFISAPAMNESGTGSTDAPATPLLVPGEFDSIPAGSPAEGRNASMPRFHYVNSFPVTSMTYGIDTLAPRFFKGATPDLAVSGFNVGANSGATVLLSGTVGAAAQAAKLGLPSVAFSGTTGEQTAWDAALPEYAAVYAALSGTVVDTFALGKKPYMADGTFVNVNFPATNATSCAAAPSFKFVLSRILDAAPDAASDVVTCGNGGRLPTEDTVLDTAGCYCSVSVAFAANKTDAAAAQQQVVLKRLGSILTCLPSS